VVAGERVDGAFDDGTDVPDHLACEHRITLQTVSESEKLQIACKPDQGVQMEHSSTVSLDHAKIVGHLPILSLPAASRASNTATQMWWKNWATATGFICAVSR